MSTLEEILNEGTSQLFRFPYAKRDAKILLCKSASISSEQFYTNPEKKLTKKQADQFASLLKKRILGFPLAYLTGKKEFWSLEFTVDSSVLIPRPETELIIENAVNLSSHTGTIIDIGTGCGNIAISLAHEFPEMRIVATDISIKALETALLNAKNNNLERIEFYRGNMFAPLRKLKLEGRCEFIVSNPPYVSEDEWRYLSPEIVEHEPKKALVAGHSGLECIENLVNQAPTYLTSGGFLIFEFGAGQKDHVLNLFGHDWIDVSCSFDLYGKPRIIVAQKGS